MRGGQDKRRLEKAENKDRGTTEALLCPPPRDHRATPVGTVPDADTGRPGEDWMGVCDHLRGWGAHSSHGSPHERDPSVKGTLPLHTGVKTAAGGSHRVPTGKVRKAARSPTTGTAADNREGNQAQSGGPTAPSGLCCSLHTPARHPRKVDVPDTELG